MGLRHCFTAEQRLWNRLHPPNHPLPKDGLGIGWHDALVAAPRIFEDSIGPCETELWGTEGYAFGGLWVAQEANAYDSTTIHYANLVGMVDEFGGRLAHWTFDGMYGRAVSHPAAPSPPPANAPPLYDDGALSGVSGALTLHYRISSAGVQRYCHEPTGLGTGLVWEYGYLGDGVQALVLDPWSMYPTDALGAFDAQQFKKKDGVTPATVGNAFAICRAQDRVFIQTEAKLSEVSVYRYSTRQYLTSIYTPNQCNQIVVTAEGYCYLVDSRDWVCLYDFDGVYQNAFRNQRRETYQGMYGGLCYGWDPLKKRLLAVGMRPNSPDGQCRCRIEGYYPIVEPAGAAPPIPRNVPRKGRTVYFASRLYGEGGEPLAGRHMLAAADPAALTLNTPSTVTDQHGEVNIQATCLATGTQQIEVTADGTIPDPPDPEPQPEPPIAGRTLQVDIVWPQPRSENPNTNWHWHYLDCEFGEVVGPPLPLIVRVTGGVGPFRVRLWTGGYAEREVWGDTDVPGQTRIVQNSDREWQASYTRPHSAVATDQFTFVVDDLGDNGNTGQDGRVIVSFAWDGGQNESGEYGPNPAEG